MTLVTIAKRFDFDAAHFLPRVPDGHKCKNMHGHTYAVEIACNGAKDEYKGWLVDYASIDEAWRPLHALLDHTTLNNSERLQTSEGGMPSKSTMALIDNPTTENLAVWIWDRLKVHRDVGRLLYEVRIFESSSTWASFKGYA